MSVSVAHHAGERDGADTLAGAPMWARIPVSWLYAAGRMADRASYTSGLRRRHALGRSVLCVGNLSVGGTGKTPLLISLTNRLREAGRRPAILSRGYGARPEAVRPRIVSDGVAPQCRVAEAGDEPYLIALRCPGVPVVIGASRYDAGKLASLEFNPDVFILDDGFQHDALHRSADLVLWDMRDDPDSERQLPAGRLREGVGALRRASAVILTHAEHVDEALRAGQRRRVLAGIKRRAPALPVFEAKSEFAGARPITGPDFITAPAGSIQELKGRRAVLLSGLARPEGFEAMARGAGIDVAAHLKLPDHAAHDFRVIEGLREAMDSHGADLALTTEKDAVKLADLELGETRIEALELRMRIGEPKRFEPFLAGLIGPLAELPT